MAARCASRAFAQLRESTVGSSSMTTSRTPILQQLGRLPAAQGVAGRRSFSKHASARLSPQDNFATRSSSLSTHSRTFTTSLRRQNNAPRVELSPQPIKPRRRFRFLRWTYRLVQLSVLAATGYVGYGIWVSRHPADQFEPDPTKKTLVVLGTGWGSVSLLKKLDTENYNVIVVSPRNYFLFTPLLPSCTTGTIEHRSIMEPIRNFLRHKKAAVKYYEAEATKIDYEKKVVYIDDQSDVKGDVSSTEIPFDMLVVGVGAENATFGESCFPPIRHTILSSLILM